MLGEVTDRDGNSVTVPMDLRLRAASQLYSKGMPDQALLDASLEEITPKLVAPMGVGGIRRGNLHELRGVPGPEEVIVDWRNPEKRLPPMDGVLGATVTVAGSRLASPGSGSSLTSEGGLVPLGIDEHPSNLLHRSAQPCSPRLISIMEVTSWK